ncbi:MAG: hypothetical protein IPJ87_13820 [Flavobacteriales bacterium]|nr:hypothetical protein [Flavobacteriales bacterium]MBK7942929.1 hypothetical protein [Flavobacteriales bacterium]MBK8947588.1 hypothetical protein [Flavobacteriales bacterium]MBK9698671.1 hypothetical protein [Flavobacteriales bacterium]
MSGSYDHIGAKHGPEYELEALLAGEGTVVVGLRNQVIASTPRFTPRALMLRITGHLSSAH